MYRPIPRQISIDFASDCGPDCTDNIAPRHLEEVVQFLSDDNALSLLDEIEIFERTNIVTKGIQEMLSRAGVLAAADRLETKFAAVVQLKRAGQCPPIQDLFKRTR